MDNSFTQDARTKQEIERLNATDLSVEQKQQRRAEIIRSSIIGAPKQSSFKTILQISNTMMGSSILILPLLFNEGGLIVSIAITILFSFLSWKTCSLILIHNKQEEYTYIQQIERIIGQNYKLVYQYSNTIMLQLTSSVYFILVCDMLYQLIQTILKKYYDATLLQKSDISFSEPSYQLMGLILIVLLSSIRSQSIILKLVSYGFISIIAYITFILYQGLLNYDKLLSYKLYSFNFKQLCGTLSYAFLIHPILILLVKSNRHQTNNLRDLNLSYLQVSVMYILIGIAGSLPIVDVDCNMPTTILDCLPQEIPTIIITVLIIIQQMTLYPLFLYLAQQEFNQIFYQNKKPPLQIRIFHQITVTCITLALQFFNIKISLIISLIGSVIGWFQLYLIPIIMHLKCLYQTMNKQQIQYYNSTYSSEYVSDVNISFLGELHCNDHSLIQKNKNKFLRYLFYITLLLFGIGIGIVNMMPSSLLGL